MQGSFCQWETTSHCIDDWSPYGLDQWEMTLHCNVVSHWLSPCTERSLKMVGWPLSVSFFESCWLWLLFCNLGSSKLCLHDDVIKWRHFPRYWPFVRRIHRSPVNSPHKGQWRGALMFTLICARIKGWVNNREAGDLRRNRAHYDVIVMWLVIWTKIARPVLNMHGETTSVDAVT